MLRISDNAFIASEHADLVVGAVVRVREETVTVLVNYRNAEAAEETEWDAERVAAVLNAGRDKASDNYLHRIDERCFVTKKLLRRVSGLAHIRVPKYKDYLYRITINGVDEDVIDFTCDSMTLDAVAEAFAAILAL